LKKLLIISFDLFRKGESKKSLAISSLLSYLKNDRRYGIDFFAYHLPINMFKLKKKYDVHHLRKYLDGCNIHNLDFIAISAYIWNEYLINELMKLLRKDYGFRGKNLF